MEDSLSIINKTKKIIPKIDFCVIKNNILGKNYDLSIAFVGEATSRKLNKTWRGKDRATNVLSFSLNKKSGELVLCPHVIKKETTKFEKNFTELIRYLVIHGMLHLDGMQHGAIMDKAEKKYSQKYDKKHRSGHRRRDHDDTSHRGRVFKRRKNS